MNIIDKEQFSRSRRLLGDDAMERLAQARVAVFGLGGVGSWAAEALVRTGLQHITIVDFDTVAPSNINRQMPATTATVGMSKTEVVRRHLLLINPDADIVAVNAVYTPDTAADFRLDDYDYVIDAIDSLRDKALLINNATRSRCRLFSSMGAALKTDPTRIAVAEFSKVKGCRLAAALRQRFKRDGVYPRRKFKAVYSPEIVENKSTPEETAPADSPIRKPIINGSLMQITATFGLNLAALVINDIAQNHHPKS